MGQVMVDELNEQFRRQWETLREIVSSVPDDQWLAGEMAPLVPGRLVYHILSGTEVYARSCPYEVYLARRTHGQDWLTAEAATLPDRSATLGHIDEMERNVASWLVSEGDDGLAAGDEGFPWTGSRKLGRALYLLRHTQTHIGEANSELRRRGLERGKWK